MEDPEARRIDEQMTVIFNNIDQILKTIKKMDPINEAQAASEEPPVGDRRQPRREDEQSPQGPRGADAG